MGELIVKRIAMILAVLMLALTMASAFPVNTLEQVDVHEKGVFYVEITNPYSELKDLEINFYTPAEAKVNAPTKIAPNTNTTIQITVYNKYETYREITSTLEVKLGDETEAREVNLRFFAMEGTADNPLAGMFGLGAFASQSSDFTLAEWGIFWVLVIIAAILVIALVARVVHRV